MVARLIESDISVQSVISAKNDKTSDEQTVVLIKNKESIESIESSENSCGIKQANPPGSCANEESVIKNGDEDIEGYRKAAELGDVEAQFMLGWSYSKGVGVTKNTKVACEWFRKAAEQGDVESQYCLGLMYEIGDGVAQDTKTSISWYRKAAEQGDARTQYILGVRYVKGEGVPKDYKVACDWYLKAAEQGYAKAQYSLGLKYMRGEGVAKNNEEAYKWCHKAAEQGYSRAQNTLGVMYLKGEGVTKDVKAAYQCYQKAAEQGYSIAQSNLGFMYQKGVGVAKEAAIACEWYQKAAKQGYAEAQCNLGLMYAKGYGVVKDEKAAVECFRKSAKQDYAKAQFALGFMYEKGKGVASDDNVACEWYSSAAKLGYVRAQEALSRLNKRVNDEHSKLQKNEAQKSEVKKDNRPNVKRRINFEIVQSRTLLRAIPEQDIKFEKQLGVGQFSTVYKGEWRFIDVAIKQRSLENFKDKESKRKIEKGLGIEKGLENGLECELENEFEREFQSISRLNSPNIVQFYGYCLKPQFCLVMEYLPGGSLFQLLHSNTVLSWEMRLRMATDIALGLVFLHQENIVHGNVKSSNVMLNQHMQAKLTDFGFSKFKSVSQALNPIEGNEGKVGNFQWMAPETLVKNEYTKESDMYSFGIMLWELSSRKIPFQQTELSQVTQQAAQGIRDKIPEDCPKRLSTLIQACWETEAQKRPTSNCVAEYLKSNQDDFPTFLSIYKQTVTKNANSASMQKVQNGISKI